MSATLLQLEMESLDALDPPFSLDMPDQWQCGILFASPHSGRNYPQSFLSRSPLTARELRQNEDVFIDDLFRPAAEFGAPLLSADFPRCFVDVTRAPDELPQAWNGETGKSTVRAEAGLGVIPTQLSEHVAIYAQRFDPEFARARLDRLYHPYHHRLAQLLGQAKSQFGQALLIDCHSMPGFAPMGARRPDIILGDRFGVSCHPDTLNRVEYLFRAYGYSVARNYPYAGGYVTAHYGKPDQGIEAIQIEINRDLYFNPVRMQRKRGYHRLADHIADIIGTLIDERGRQSLLAAQ